MKYSVCFLWLVIFFTANQALSQNLENASLRKPIQVSGGIGAQAVVYQVQGIPNRRKPFSYIFNGNLNVNLFNTVSMPVSFIYSEQQRTFQQPFNQLGFSPQYKWLTVHAGYRSLRWGEYSLAGFNFLLGGAEVQTKKFRSGFVYGRINRETRPDTAGETRSLLPSFRRMAYSGRLGYGTSSNFVDLVFLRSWDQGDSLPVSSLYKAVRPQENAVAAITTQQRFGKGFSFRAEYAMSATNADRQSATGANTPESFLLKLNNSGGKGNALTASAGYQGKGISAEAGIRRTDLDFRSFGGYYYNTNFINAWGNFGYQLLKNKVRIQHTLQTMNDNANGKKNITTNRMMPGTTIDWQAGSHFGLNMNYTGVFARQKVATDTFTSNLITRYLLNQANHTFSMMPRYNVKKGDRMHVLMLMATFQTNSDANPETKKYSQLNTNFINLVYSLNQLKSGIGYTFSAFRTQVTNYAISQQTFGANAGVNKSMNKGKLNLATNASGSFNPQGTTVNWTINAVWRPGKKHSFTLNTSLISFSPKTGTSFTEEQLRFMYFFNF